MRKTIFIILGVIVVALIVAFATGLLDIDQTQEAALPEVTVEGGQLPEAEVKTGEIKVGTETVEVETPTIEIVPADEEAGIDADVDVDVDVETDGDEADADATN